MLFNVESEYGSDWEKVISQDRNCQLGYIGLAKAYYIEGDYEKALFVHEELVKRLSYDHELAAAVDEPTPEVKLNSSMYGAFVNNKTICRGYAQAYQYVMKKLGIECAYVSGKAEDTTER